MIFGLKITGGGLPFARSNKEYNKIKSFIDDPRYYKTPDKMWKSRVSWRIAFAVFLTILAVQITILSLTLKDYENMHLNELREIGRSAILPLLGGRVTDLYQSPIDDAEAARVIGATKVEGITIYTNSADLQRLRSYGAPISLTLTSRAQMDKAFYSDDKQFYEVVFSASELGKPFIIVAKLDSSDVQIKIFNYIKQTILIILLVTAFVTAVLMMALGHWLLRPILFMRNNLLAAVQNPENPEIAESPYDSRDEVGEAVNVAMKLIQLNSENIRQIKSAAEDQIHKLAYYDILTSLPNRILFVQSLNERIYRPKEGESGRFAIITVDLDHFKDINDTMGHSIGDAILRAVGRRLQASLPESAIVARTGEDEYAITMPLIGEDASSYTIAEQIVGVIRNEPYKIFSENFQVRASIGVATYPDDGKDVEMVLKNADIALNRAKEEGRDRIKEYSEDFDRAVRQRFQMLRDLRDALENNQLLVYFQPQIDLRSEKIIGAESLLRWRKPDQSKEGGKFIPPNEFISIAEQSGLIVPIGEWVLREACRKAAEWQVQGRRIRVAVNVSGAQFYQGNLVEVVADALLETGLDPSLLELEVTESVFMENITETIGTLRSLHSLGVEIAIDDFGTGYSSLSYLRQFPIDRLKIDQSFICDALSNPDDAAIAKTIIGLSHSLNLRVIAEGVETYEQQEFLREQNCDEVQGYLYCRPVPAMEFQDFLDRYNGSLAVFGEALRQA